MKTKLIPALLLIIAAANAELVSRGENTGVGARAMSMGGAFTGIADDYSALYYNPAGMTQLRNSELGLNVNYSLRTNNASPAGGVAGNRSLENIQLNDVSAVLTQGEGWAFGFGYYSPTSYNDPLQYVARGKSYNYDDLGSMDHYRLAFAYAPSPIASVGFAFTVLNGQEQLQIQDGTTVRYLEEYGGFNLEPSFLLKISKALTLGGSAVVVERLQLHDTYQEQGKDPIETDYNIKNPFQMRLGLAYQMGWTQLDLDWHGLFWNSYSYAEAGTDFYQNEPGYSNQHIFSLGVEQYLTQRGPVLRAGLSWQTESPNLLGPTWIHHPRSLNFGMGFPVSKHLGLDVGYQYRTKSYAQPSQANGPADLTISETGQQVTGSIRVHW